MSTEFLPLILNDGGRGSYFDFEAEDCVVRAISIAENADYMDIFRLVDLKRGKGRKTPHDGVRNTTLKKILREMGYAEITKGDGRMFKPSELPLDKTLLIHTARHICVFRGGATYDIIPTRRDATIHWYFVKRDGFCQ